MVLVWLIKGFASYRLEVGVGEGPNQLARGGILKLQRERPSGQDTNQQAVEDEMHVWVTCCVRDVALCTV